MYHVNDHVYMKIRHMKISIRSERVGLQCSHNALGMGRGLGTAHIGPFGENPFGPLCFLATWKRRGINIVGLDR